MKAYQEAWVEGLEEFSSGFNKPNMDNDILGVCCEIIGDDTGETSVLSSALARILKEYLICKWHKEYNNEIYSS